MTGNGRFLKVCFSTYLVRERLSDMRLLSGKLWHRSLGWDRAIDCLKYEQKLCENFSTTTTGLLKVDQTVDNFCLFFVEYKNSHKTIWTWWIICRWLYEDNSPVILCSNLWLNTLFIEGLGGKDIDLTKIERVDRMQMSSYALPWAYAMTAVTTSATYIPAHSYIHALYLRNMSSAYAVLNGSKYFLSKSTL